MNNKRFLYGLGIGILGCNIFYSLVKDKLHPIAVNIIGSAMAAGNATKSFIDEVNKKAMDNREERFKKVAENLEPRSLKDNNEVSENIDSLKKQLNELKNKIK